VTAWTAALLVIGLALLVAGAEALVRGASRLARAAGVSPLVVGLTVVALGTSSPEIAVSLGAALGGEADIAVGNVVGSNIFNILVVLGLSAVVAPLIVAGRLVRLDVPIMIGVAVGFFALALDGRLGRVDGLLLAAGAAGYGVLTVRRSPKEADLVRAEYDRALGARPRGRWRWVVDLGFVVVGVWMLAVGARWLVGGAVAVAEAVGVSTLVIGLTIVAGGTSLPEVATSVVAAFRGERDIAVGNVVGSNILNLLLVAGLAAAVAGDGVSVAPAVRRFDLPVMVAASVACLPIFFTGHCIARWEGLLFLAYYAAYSAYLILDAADHDALPAFSAVMEGFVIPLTAVTLALLAYRAWRRQGRG
jgi:cation:H+ antiporter